MNNNHRCAHGEPDAGELARPVRRGAARRPPAERPAPAPRRRPCASTSSSCSLESAAFVVVEQPSRAALLLLPAGIQEYPSAARGRPRDHRPPAPLRTVGSPNTGSVTALVLPPRAPFRTGGSPKMIGVLGAAFGFAGATRSSPENAIAPPPATTTAASP